MTEKEKQDLHHRLVEFSVEHAAEAIYWMAADARLVYVNKTACQMLGYTRDELLSMTAHDVAHDFPEELWPKHWEKVKSTGSITSETFHKAKDGRLIPVEVTISYIEVEGQEYNFAFARDITAQRQAEEALKESAQKLALHVEQTPMGVIEWDLDFQVTDWNPAAEMIFGYSREEALGRHAAGLIVPEDVRDIVDQVWSELIEDRKGNRSTNANNTKSGEIRICEWYNTPLIDSDGNVVGVTSLVQDITERKQAEERMRMMEMAVEQSADGIAVSDLEGHLQFTNFAWAQMHGYSLQEIQGQHLSIFHTEEQLRNEVGPFNERAMKVGFHQGEVGHARKDGSTFPTMMTSTVMKDEDGNPIGIIGTARDITKQKAAVAEQQRLQQEVIEAQRRALEELSTPVIPIMDRILVMPLIGSIDSMRAKDITRALLSGISQHRAKVIILDVTGVPIVDSGVANHLNKTVQAARLKGARTIVTGISDAVAETIVDLGIDWSAIETLSDLQTGLIAALVTMGVKLTNHK